MKAKARVSGRTRMRGTDDLAEQLETVAHAEDAAGAEADRGEQDDALKERLPERRQVEDEEQILDAPQYEGAEDRADDTAAAAEQRGAADHHRGDRVERIGAAGRCAGLAGEGDEGEQQAGEGGEETAEDI